jgi:hypothetical protein
MSRTPLESLVIKLVHWVSQSYFAFENNVNFSSLVVSSIETCSRHVRLYFLAPFDKFIAYDFT